MMPQAKLMHSAGSFRCEQLEKNLTLSLGLDGSAVLHSPGPLPPGWLVPALDQLFVAAPQLTGIALPYAEWREEPQAQAVFALSYGDYLARDLFYQLPLWLGAERHRATDQMQYDAERDIWFPQRAARPNGEVYRRFDPHIKHTLSFRLPEIDRDTEQFTRWMNSPRVDAFWEMSGPLEVQAAYLQRQLDSHYCYPLLGCFDDQPFGYFEVYWAAEDRIGRHYRWQPFDRGLHMLVGEERWRGAQYIRSWLRGLTHYLYLDEPRTTRVVAEPRADNQRLFRHLPAAGYHTLKEFDFPHKRSRLIVNQRADFFQEGTV
ncbi:GNAT family N-acetyltransferase [Yersinia enterocolitica]|uniref:GNAT family N-acetyltransferase n=1 Tax=unclassified Yersinia (in: enterobacteria) TaxID=2653513 RepID=UPI0009F6BDC5|nr:N-acetyltransferase [Yersinia enterocolitica]